MADELIDIYDEAHRWMGTASKKAAHRLGLWHYSIQCWMYRVDEHGSVFLLFQKRGADKHLFPNSLDITAAGHYQAGEEVADGVREISEELGVSLELTQLRYLGLRTEVVLLGELFNQEFCRVYLWESPLPPAEFTPSPDEVEGLVEISVDDGLALFSDEVDEVVAKGIEWRDGEWQPYEGMLTRELFVPRYDPYYYKMFIMARLAAAGEKHLAV